MNVFTKQRLTSSLIILLVILNILLLSTFWVKHFSRMPSIESQKPAKTTPVPQFLAQELELTPKQTQSFEALRQNFFQESKMINADIQALKEAIMQELFAETPDSSKISMLAEEIGAKYAELEKRRFQHFWELKTNCSPEQLVRFQGIFRELFPGSPDLSPKRNVPLELTPVLEFTNPLTEEEGEQEAPAEIPNACQDKFQGELCQCIDSQGITLGTCLPVGPGSDLLCVPREEEPNRNLGEDELDELDELDDFSNDDAPLLRET